MRILICGLGSVGQRHIRIIRAVLGDGVEIAAWRRRGRAIVINDDLSVVEGMDPARHYGIAAFDGLDAALAWGPDAVFVTNPISMHVETARRAIEAGCHVFIEKPLAHDDEGVEALCRAACERGRVLQPGYQLRHHPAVAEMRRMLEEGRLGRLCAAHLQFGEYLPAMHAYEDYRDTHMARADQGGGAIRCLSHDIDLACFLFGAPASVYAVGGHLSGLELDGVEDTASLLFTLDRPHGRVPVHVHLDFLQRPPVRHLRIVGDRGRVEFRYLEALLEHHDIPSGTLHRIEYRSWQRNQMFMDEVAHFFARIHGAGDAAAAAHDTLRTHRACMAALRSLRSGTVVAIGDGA